MGLRYIHMYVSLGHLLPHVSSAQDVRGAQDVWGAQDLHAGVYIWCV